MMKFSFSAINLVFGLTLFFVPSQGQGALNNAQDDEIIRDVIGVEIKEAVNEYLKTHQIQGSPMVRDDKFFFTCADNLEIKQQMKLLKQLGFLALILLRDPLISVPD